MNTLIYYEFKIETDCFSELCFNKIQNSSRNVWTHSKTTNKSNPDPKWVYYDILQLFWTHFTQTFYRSKRASLYMSLRMLFSVTGQSELSINLFSRTRSASLRKFSQKKKTPVYIIVKINIIVYSCRNAILTAVHKCNCGVWTHCSYQHKKRKASINSYQL